MLLKSRSSLTCFGAYFLPGRAKDLSAPLYKCTVVYGVGSMLLRNVYTYIYVCVCVYTLHLVTPHKRGLVVLPVILYVCETVSCALIKNMVAGCLGTGRSGAYFDLKEELTGGVRELHSAVHHSLWFDRCRDILMT